MPLNKTLYIRDEDAPIWEESRDYFKDTLTSFLTQQLKTAIAERKATSMGLERIVLRYRDREKGYMPFAKAFYGRWIFSPEEPWHHPSDPDANYTLAFTAKEKIVVFDFVGRNEDQNFSSGRFEVFDSFDAAIHSSHVPNDLVAESMERIGIMVQELDI